MNTQIKMPSKGYLASLLVLMAVISGLVMVTAGCGTLAPGGVYKSDQALYNADLTIATSYDLMHAFVLWEYNNRAALAPYPEIKRAADEVRVNARQWITSAIALRDVYASNPTESNLEKLQATLSLIRAALTEATKYMAQYQPQPLK